MTTHPLEMVTGDEITRAAAIVRADARSPRPRVRARRAPRARQGRARGRAPPCGPREVRSSPGPSWRDRGGRRRSTRGEVREWEHVEGMRPALLFGEAMNAIFTTKEHPDYVAALARRGITDLDNVQIDPWPAGVVRLRRRDRPAHRALHLVPARDPGGQRLRPADRGPHRPLRPRSQRGDRGDRPRRRCRCPTQHARYFARGPRAAAHRPEADRDHPARGPELHRRRQPRALAEVVAAHRVRPVRGARAAPGRATTTTGASARSCTARRSARWSCPYGDPGPLHGWKNAFDAGEWGLGRMTQSLTLGCDCLGEIHYFDARARERDRRAVHDRERDLPARGGLRDPLEARRPVQRHAARCAAAAGSS